MIIMNLKLDNILSFENFEINFSYPKKIVNSPIENEYLLTKTNFRYKKINILMGANASGKTSIGKIIMYIFNFISKKEISNIEKIINDKSKSAYFSIDFLINDDYLYRINCTTLFEENVSLEIYKTKIGKNDSYESCVKKLKKITKEDPASDGNNDYVIDLSLIPNFGWLFTFPEYGSKSLLFDDTEVLDIRILKSVLMTLDTYITDIVSSNEVKNAYIIKTKSQDVFVQNGEIKTKDILSSGTEIGLDISYILSSLCKDAHGFYYCDEKFSFIQSDVEQAVLTLMLKALKRGQLFFTSHNLDLLEMNFPLHSFTFLKKEENIEVVYPTKYIQKNDKSLRNAVKNNIFDTAPDLEMLFDLEGICIK
ncbi:MAG: ATP-binding protein [Bacilli bacterium]